MKKEESLFIARFRIKLIIWEIVKCLFVSIVVAIIVDVVILKVLFESISHLFAFIIGTIFNFPFVYFLFFGPEIKKIKNNIWNLAKEKSAEKVEKLDNKKSNTEHIISQILLLSRLEKQKQKWQNRIYQIEMDKPL